MATAVQIELRVDEKGAVQGVRSFDSAIKGTQANVVQLNRELSTVNAQSGVQKLEKEFTAGESSLRTMNAEVRSLQGSIYGDSRAAAEFLAIFPKLGEAMELAFPLFGAVALIGVLVEAGEKVHELYDKYLSLSSAAKEYNDEVAKAKEQDFGNSHSIETTIARINEATEAVEKYKRAAADEHGNMYHASRIGNALGIRPELQDPLPYVQDPLRFFYYRYKGNQAQHKQYDEQRKIDKLKPEGFAQQHEATLDAIRISHSSSDHLSHEQQITEELQRQRAINEENASYQYEQDKSHNNTAKFPQEELDRKNRLAQIQADRKLSDLHRDQAHELERLYDEATNARLRGSALYEAQEKQAIRELEYEGIRADKARAAVSAKFDAEKMRRLQDELYATQEIQAKAAASGLTGVARVQAEGAIQVGDIRGNEHLSDTAKDQRVNAAKETTRNQILDQERQFSQQIDSIADESATHQLQGFARIHAAESKQLDDLKKKFDETYGHMDMSAEGASDVYAKGKSDYARGVTAIHRGTADQVNELARRNADETAAIEAQAHVRFLSAEKQKTAAIEAEYEQRRNKLVEQYQQQEIDWDNYNRRLVAAGEERDAELVEAATAAREKMARQFESVFRSLDHPLRMMQDLGAKAAAEAAATMVQKYQAHHNGGSGAATATGGLGGIFGGIFHPHHGPSPDLAAEMAGTRTGESRGMFALQSAVITVGAAQIAFAGGLPSSGGVTGVASASTRGMGFAPSSAGDLGGFLSGGTFSGGAGSGGSPDAPAHTSGGVMPSQGSGIAGIGGDLQQGMDLFSSAKGIFGGKGSSSKNGLEPTDPDIPNGHLNADGSYTSDASGGGILQGGGFGANAMGAAGGVLGLYGAFESNGGFGGAASGAMSGMELGMALGGPVGAAVGAAAGAIVGAIGFGGREKAHVYDLKTVRPRIQTDQLAYNAGSMDYMSAYSDMQALDKEAKKTTDSMGPAAKSYYHDTIEREIHQAIQKFGNEEKAGRSQYTATAAQYDIGVDRVPYTGLAVIHKDERIIPSDENRQITRAMNLHASYQAAMQRGTASMAMMTRGDTHLHFHAHDSKTAMQFFMDNKHTVRRALNESYAENSGGSDA